MSGLVLLKILKDNWKLVALVIGVISVLGYIEFLRLEVSHYKKAIGSYEEAIQSYKDESEILDQRLKVANEKIAKTAAEEQKAKLLVIETNKALLAERIKNDKASRDIKLLKSTVELFNATTNREAAGTTQGNAGNDGKTDSTETAFTLNDLLRISNENNQNHLACIAQVETWQDFWTRYVKSLGYQP